MDFMVHGSELDRSVFDPMVALDDISIIPGDCPPFSEFMLNFFFTSFCQKSISLHGAIDFYFLLYFMQKDPYVVNSIV